MESWSQASSFTQPFFSRWQFIWPWNIYYWTGAFTATLGTSGIWSLSGQIPFENNIQESSVIDFLNWSIQYNKMKQPATSLIYSNSKCRSILMKDSMPGYFLLQRMVHYQNKMKIAIFATNLVIQKHM